MTGPTPSRGAPLEISTLGPLVATRSGVEASLGGRRQQAILARLAIAHTDVVPAERILDELWNGAPPQSATNTLQSYVSNLRRLLGDDPGSAPVIERVGEGYRLARGPGVVLTASRFEAAVAEASGQRRASAERVAVLEQALDLWRGPALDVFAGEAWAHGEAVRLEELRLAAEELRFDDLLALGHHTSLVGDLEAAVLEHPLRERLTTLLVTALYRCGRQAEALRAYERTRAHLGEELGLDPSPELAQLANDVLGHAAHLRAPEPADRPLPEARSTSGASASTGFGDVVLPLPPAVAERRTRSPFVGRVEERAELAAAWEEVVEGGRELLVLEGEPGAGKTRLVQQLAADVHASGGNVLWGRCTTDEFGAFQPIVEAFRTAARAVGAEDLAALLAARPAIASLLPELAPDGLPARTERWELFEAIAGAWEEGSRHHPMLLVVDDLQWADPSTISLLDHVLVQGGASRILIVATLRRPAGRLTPEVDRLLVDARRHHRLSMVAVGGITTDDVAELLGARGVQVAPGQAEELHARTGGNPFFLEALAERGADAEPLDARDVPDSVRDVLDARLAELPDDAVGVLCAAAVIGPRVDLAILGATVDLEVDALLDVVDEAVASGLLVEDEEIGWVTFPHALVRAALVARTTRNREARLHARAASAIEAAPTAIDREPTIARHLLAARSLVEPARAAQAALVAGRQALNGLTDEDARSWGTQALAVLERVDGERARRLRTEVLLLLAECGRLLGQVDLEVLEQATSAALDLGDATLVSRVVYEQAVLGAAHEYPWATGVVDQRLDHLLERSLEVVGEEEEAARALVLSCAAIVHSSRSDVERYRDDAAAARALEPHLAAHPSIRSQVLITYRMSIAGPTGLEDRLALHPSLLEVAPAQFDLQLSTYSFLATDLLEAARLDEARAMREELRAFAARFRRPWYDAYVHFLDGLYAYLEGRPEEGDERFALGSATGAPGHTGAESQYAHGRRLMTARATGTLDALLPDLRRTAEQHPGAPVWQALLADAHAAAGDPGQAASAYRPLLVDGALAVSTDEYLWYLIADVLAEVAWTVGDPELGRAVADAIEPFADRIGVIGHHSLATGPLQLPHGLALAAAGREREAVDALDQVRRAARTAGFVPTEARASAALAQLAPPDQSGDGRDGGSTEHRTG